MKYYQTILVATSLLFSANANAVVINTLNGVDYEWLELTETIGLNRYQVEAIISDTNSSLYGYQYASRQQIEDLFLSYVPWDGINGVHDNSIEVNGISALINDFGSTGFYSVLRNPRTSVDSGDTLTYGQIADIRGLYGLTNECGADLSCAASIQLYIDSGVNTGTGINQRAGWSASSVNPGASRYDIANDIGSFLVREVSTVPVPAAFWLFGSGLIAIIGFARRHN